MENIVKILRGSLSQSELAKRSGVSQQNIANYELGRFPKPEILEKIARAVGKKVEWIIKDIEEEKTK
ncbi:MAG: helix-turn-helix transcriptional regulator [Desulfuromonadaceae bacterium]|nr:helix-turn-helix transcriptional regulator [Desulfuromonadaceae bacterium]